MTATYFGSGDPARRRTDYFPVWLKSLAGDVTLEASAMEGAAEGPEAVRAIILAVKDFYPYQDLSFYGDYDDDGFIEEYATELDGRPLGVMGVISRNASGETQHIVINHRPRSSVVLLARLMGEKLAGTPYAKYFVADEN
jgi:hypothetical protein